MSLSNLTEVKDALNIIRTRNPIPEKTAEVSAVESLNKILAEDLVAARDIPRFDNSAMDGFVMRESDLNSGRRSFAIAGEVRPENTAPAELPSISSGTCARIMTGSRIPPEADFVIPVELTRVFDGKLQVRELPSNNSIRKQGEGYRKGNVILKKGTVIRPHEVGLIIESGVDKVCILAPLSIGLQVSGNEIDRSNNTNGPVLNAIISTWPGVDVSEYPVLQDNPDFVISRLTELKKNHNVIITTGGISAGEYDYFFVALTKAGAECLIRKINQKPGKPFTLFAWEDVYICCLPGNPVSAVFTADYYVRKLVYQMRDLPQPEPVRATALHEMSNPGSKTLFVPGKLQIDNGIATVQADVRMRSHLMKLFTGNQVFVRLNPGETAGKGDLVECTPFSTASL